MRSCSNEVYKEVKSKENTWDLETYALVSKYIVYN